MNREIWKDIEGYKGLYQVSNKGRVKSMNYRGIGREGILKPVINSRGYCQVIVYVNSNRTHKLIHRLVAEAFIPNPNNLPQVNHIDECKLNNHISNLEWCTAEQNMNHGTRNERAATGRSKPVIQYDMNGGRVARYNSTAESARLTGIGQGSIYLCCTGKFKSAGGFVWRFEADSQ